ncbi:hypothetical protein [Tateyamaria sp. SN3-11]|uniref:hypothetical protein n=1 Tax=Tateyamaria sp. SN3-11 TaxID=3092147 RepID=UPI0039E76BE7
MADEIIKFTADSTAYVPLGAGSTGVAVQNEHAYAHLRLAIADSQPDANHGAYMILRQRNFVQHLEIPDTFTVWARSDTDGVTVTGHYRKFL